MNELVKEYLEREETREWFVNYIRISNVWDDKKYIEMISLIKSILKEYKDSYLIPKDLIYFFSREIDFIIEITEHHTFFNLNLPFIKTGEDRKQYKEMVEKRVLELKDMRDEFLYGEI